MTTSGIALFGFVVLLIILLGFAAIVLLKILTGSISLEGIITEMEGDKASLSRFQFLIFTFLIAGLFLMLTIESGSFVQIPETVLGLLGISGGSYVISKAVGSQGTQKKAQTDFDERKSIAEAGAQKVQAEAGAQKAQAEAEKARIEAGGAV